MMSVRVFIIFCFLLVGSCEVVLAQNPFYVQREDTLDGFKFQAQSTFKSNLKDDANIIKSADISVAWWLLLGEIIEDYKFEWQIQTPENASNAKISFPGIMNSPSIRDIYLSELFRYSDLRERYLQLVPSELTIRVSGRLDDAWFKKEVSSSSLILLPSGKNSNFSFPGAYGWKTFVTSGIFAFCKEDTCVKGGFERALKMNQGLYIQSVEFIDVVWPIYELADIYKEFFKRTTPLDSGNQRRLNEIFETIDDFSHEYAVKHGRVLTRQDKMEPTDLTSDEVVDLVNTFDSTVKYDKVDFWSETFIEEYSPLALEPFYENGLRGYKDSLGVVRIQPYYDEAYRFVNGLAIVKKGSKYALISTQNEVLYGWTESKLTVRGKDHLEFIELQEEMGYKDDIFYFSYWVGHRIVLNKEGVWVAEKSTMFSVSEISVKRDISLTKETIPRNETERKELERKKKEAEIRKKREEETANKRLKEKRTNLRASLLAKGYKELKVE